MGANLKSIFFLYILDDNGEKTKIYYIMMSNLLRINLSYNLLRKFAIQ